MKAQILSKPDIDRAVTRIAHEILERNRGPENLMLLGLLRGGEWLAAALAKRIEALEGVSVPQGTLDVTNYRDDAPREESDVIGLPLDRSNIPVSPQDKVVILVDDVIFTGRTVRAALDSLLSRARASKVQLAVIVDRGHREVPIRPDYVGKNLPTSLTEYVEVTPEVVRIYQEALPERGSDGD
ncbi:MAG: bifunctional pyr operon transcriptional regulator/uracil phosphoribosyltransferase PyrR [Actinomycetota bacterium]|jgi:pyrimidine operon attenuation protein/uracil phosphoribosyltransferase|nr:bifunctional pyr operon transcriptional regulator/uracil phosphoribosyltransferase PyrR [Actinomycetota bacterium]